MGRISNDEVMARFRQIDETNDATQIKRIHDQIIKDLSFLVYSNTHKYRKFINYEDLNQEGFVGLIKATQRFDYRRFPNFFVFANQWIINGIRRSAKKYDVMYSPKRIKTIYSNEEELSVQEEADGPEEYLCRQERSAQIYSTIGSLPAREYVIITRLFGIGTRETTLRETGKFCDLTYERIRQIKNQIIDQLKSNNSLMELGG